MVLHSPLQLCYNHLMLAHWILRSQSVASTVNCLALVVPLLNTELN